MPPVMLLLKGLRWQAIGLAALAIALIGIGWTAQGWRKDARWNEREAAIATANTKASEAAREREQVLADAIAIIDSEHTAERTKADAENSRLRAAVADGAVRLFIRAACPAAGLPQAAAGPGLDHGTRAELNSDARSDYHALREGLTRQDRKLAACQEVLARERTAP